ncbi:MAG TPA: DUF6401 family natural product biosynthesis protein [Trebonia sp.]|nr:DUF6401 family natural product biosynthesis protein [Trebonia sp.]
MVLQIAGEAGQVSLAQAASSPGTRASVDQHVAEVRNALAACGRPVTPATLVSYAQGFTEAAIGRGWWPPHRQLDEAPVLGMAALPDEAARPEPGPGGERAAALQPRSPQAGGGAVLDGIPRQLQGPREASPGLASDPARPAPGPDRADAHPGPGQEASRPPLDWESLRLAAICRMLIESQGLGLSGC